MPNDQRPNGASAPNPNPWREHAASLENIVVAVERGSVQFVGRAPLAIGETVVVVPIAQLFGLVAQLLAAPYEAQRVQFVNAELARFAREPHGG